MLLAGRGRATRTRVLGVSGSSSFCPSTDKLSSRASAISGFKILLSLGLAKSSRILANWSGSMESSSGSVFRFLLRGEVRRRSETDGFLG